MAGSLFHGLVDVLCGIQDTNHILRSGCVNFNYSVGRTLITTAVQLHLLFGVSLALLGVFLICRNFASGDDLF